MTTYLNVQVAPRFVRLVMRGGTVKYVNINRIIKVYRDDTNVTTVIVYDDHNIDYTTQTPEEILDIIG